MPLIAQVGRKSWQPRLLLTTFYLLLSAGSVTMVYPFLLMLANSTTSSYDWRHFRLVPKYLYDDFHVYAKYITDKDGRELFGERYARSTTRHDTLTPEDFDHVFALSDTHLERRAQDLSRFISETCSDRFVFPAFSWQNQETYSPLWLRDDYVLWLKTKYGSLEAVAQTHGYPYEKWINVGLQGLDPLLHSRLQSNAVNIRDVREFILDIRKSQPGKVSLFTADAVFQQYLVQRYGTIDRFNQKNSTAFTDFTEIHLAPLRKTGELALDPSQADPRRRRPLEYFLRHELPLAFYRLDPALRGQYETFVKQRKFALADYPFTTLAPDEQKQVVLWVEFIERNAPLEQIHIVDPVVEFRDDLQQRYGQLAALNAAHGTAWKQWDEVQRLPLPEMDYVAVSHSTGSLRWQYFTANYREVFGFLAGHGRAFLNTLIYVALAILGALTVNPLAAYALARFRLKHATKILVFLLATMAFPVEVAMIPSFLLVRDLGMMNTFWALVLPGLASGFSIFLLKGFFESLPSELYEAGLIDGASELRMFWKITLPLCKPILAVIALGAFTAAYGAFIFAFLTCQDPKMWTLMVFLYEFQQQASNGLIMASLVAAAVPTLVVFLFCQNIILRGIVIPSFK